MTTSESYYESKAFMDVWSADPYAVAAKAAGVERRLEDEAHDINAASDTREQAA